MSSSNAPRTLLGRFGPAVQDATHVRADTDHSLNDSVMHVSDDDA